MSRHRGFQAGFRPQDISAVPHVIVDVIPAVAPAAVRVRGFEYRRSALGTSCAGKDKYGIFGRELQHQRKPGDSDDGAGLAVHSCLFSRDKIN
jgi:hypothetical protein